MHILYLHRCVKEWRLALHLSQDPHKYTIVVAAAISCSRPLPLKERDFLYLDFIEHRNQTREKKEYIWNKLIETISMLIFKGGGHCHILVVEFERVRFHI